jgi:ketosteroid isomerase-like protein
MHQKEQEEAMMMRSLAIAALVIGLAGPAVAEQKSTADQKTRQEIEAFMNKWVDAYNRADGNTMISMTASDSFGVGDHGVMTGDQRIERIIQNEQKSGGKVTNLRVEEVRMIGRNAAVAAGPYTVTYSNPRPLTLEGTWMQVLEREHGAWKSVATGYTPKFNRPEAAGAGNQQPSSGSSTQQ